MSRQAIVGLAACAALSMTAAHARAGDAIDASAPSAASNTQGAAQAPSAPASARVSGLGVVALAGASAPAWTLAQAVYANDALRPATIDEAHARVLAGEAPPAGASKELADLAETRAAVRGDDAPSRAILASLANTFHLRGIVVVEMDREAHPSAHVFLADAGMFDAARYAPDAQGSSGGAGAADAAAPSVAWSGAAASLARAFASPAAQDAPQASPASAPAPDERARAQAAPALATSPLPDARVPPGGEEKSAPTPFYKSPWFWGALGAAAFGGATLYFATRDNSNGTIHLQMQAPR